MPGEDRPKDPRHVIAGRIGMASRWSKEARTPEKRAKNLAEKRRLEAQLVRQKQRKLDRQLDELLGSADVEDEAS